MSLRSNGEWETLAKRDPLFAIASDKGKRKSDGGWDRGAFFAKGEGYMELISPALGGLSIESKALDLGCGAGRISRALAARFASVIGVDVAPSMVALAAELCSDVSNAEFRVGSGQSLPLQDGEVGIVVSLQVLQHIDPDALPNTLGECHRVLAAGGTSILHIPGPSKGAARRRWMRLIPMRYRITKLVQRIMPNVDISGRAWVVTQYHCYREAQIKSMLEAAGFESVTSFEFRPDKPATTTYVAIRQ